MLMFNQTSAVLTSASVHYRLTSPCCIFFQKKKAYPISSLPGNRVNTRKRPKILSYGTKTRFEKEAGLNSEGPIDQFSVLSRVVYRAITKSRVLVVFKHGIFSRFFAVFFAAVIGASCKACLFGNST